MSIPESVGISSSGAIRLGPDVVCDGFVADAQVRAQTHAHTDHLRGFESSKRQYIVSSPATKDILIQMYDADLPYRSNLIDIPMHHAYKTPLGDNVTLLPSNHMLGAAQVVVETTDGLHLAYSGDFGWPLEVIPEVQLLVVDSTCASRRYSRLEAEERLRALLAERMALGPLSIYAHAGTLERVLEIVAEFGTVPVIGSPEIYDLSVIFRRFGYDVPEILESSSDAAMYARNTAQFVVVASGRGRQISGEDRGTRIVVSAFSADPDDPIRETGPASFTVAMSCHATFAETLEYIEATGASIVITDNTRGNHAVELALAVRERLHLEAHVGDQIPSHRWGD